MNSKIAFNAGILALVAASFTILLAILITKKYLNKKQKATAYLTLAIYFWALTTLTASIIYLFAGNTIELAIKLQVIMYGCVFAANIFTYMFARNVLFKQKTGWWRWYIILGIICILILGIADSSEAIPFPDSTDYYAIVLKLEYSMILVVYLVPIIIRIVIVAFKTSKRMEQSGYKVGFRLIGWGQIFILCIFICDTIAGFFFDNATMYAIFLYLQWIFGVLASVSLYVGWVLPKWVKNLFNIEEDQEEIKQ
jgi:hypothetical protein